MNRHQLSRAMTITASIALGVAWIAIATPSDGATAAAGPADAHPFITVTNTTNSATPNGGTLADLTSSATDSFKFDVTGLTCAPNTDSALGLALYTPAISTANQLNGLDLSASTNDYQVNTAPWLYETSYDNYYDPSKVNDSTGVISSFSDPYFFPGYDWYTNIETVNSPVGSDLGALKNAWATVDPLANLNISPGSYSLVALCEDTDADGHVETDASGNQLAAWSTMTFDANGNWTVTQATPTVADATATALTATLGSDQSSATLKATVTDTATSGTTPTGTVSFYEGSDTTGTPVATGKVGSDGTVTETVSKLTAGSHSYTAVFVPDDSTAFSGSTSSSASVTVPTPKTATTVSLTGTAKGSEIVWTATVQKSDGSTATDTAGTVTFTQTAGGSTKDTGITVANGVATDTVTGLDPATKYAFTATYVASNSENYANSPASSAVDVTTPSARTDGTLAADSGSVIKPGSKVTATFPAGTFGDGDSFAATVHSTPESVGAGTASSTDGSISFSFTVPADLLAGAHTLELVDTTDPTQTAETAAFTVTAAATTTTDTTGTESPSNTGDPAPNDPVSFATGLVARTASVLGKPAGAGAAAGFAGLAAAAAAVWFWRRRVLLKTTTVTKR